MSTPELKKRLIDKIRRTKDPAILEEAYRLLEIETEDLGIYNLTDDQKSAIEEAQKQIKEGKFLTDDQADKDIDEWLKK